MPKSMTLSRRALLASLPALAAGGYALAAEPREITIYKSPYCGCCGGWVTHMQKAGFTTIVKEVEDLAPIRAKSGIPAKLISCHTGAIGGYVVEGHVPAEDVVRLLKERPKGIGIVVPGMPVGSPGMETGGPAQAFETLLVLDASGRTSVFAKHG